MRIDNSFTMNGKSYAVCVGSDISYGKKVRKIAVNGVIYNVKDSLTKESLTGVMQLELLIDSKTEIPTGEATVIEEDTEKAAS